MKKNIPIKNSNNCDNSIFSDFQKNLEKNAVRSVESDKSIFDQIHSIISGAKPKYSSVEEKVNEMMERSGLNSYLKQNNTKVVESQQKTASETQENLQNKKMPKALVEKPEIINTIDNIIRDTRGSMSIPAILEKIKEIHYNDLSDKRDWEDPELMMYVSRLKLKEKKLNPGNYETHHNLGVREHGTQDVDPINTDAFLSLNPVKF